MCFKNRLKKLRNEAGITQRELAEKIVSSKSKVSMWEAGHRDPSSDDILMLASIFEVSTDYLLGNSDERNPNKSSDEIVTKAFSLKEGVTELPQEALDQIDEYIRLIKLKYKK